MAFKHAGHREQVFQSPEYRRAVREWAEQGSPVPLSVFQNNYANAYFDRSGNPRDPKNGSATQQQAFVNLMRWQGRAPDEVEDWDDWLEYNDY
jgi:hypothetical protein